MSADIVLQACGWRVSTHCGMSERRSSTTTCRADVKYTSCNSPRCGISVSHRIGRSKFLCASRNNLSVLCDINTVHEDRSGCMIPPHVDLPPVWRRPCRPSVTPLLAKPVLPRLAHRELHQHVADQVLVLDLQVQIPAPSNKHHDQICIIRAGNNFQSNGKCHGPFSIMPNHDSKIFLGGDGTTCRPGPAGSGR
jgi:hypothetical protein